MTVLAVALAAVAGLAGAIQAAVMGELGQRVGVFPALAFSGIVTLVLAVAALLGVRRSLDGIGDVTREPVWLWTGGALSLVIILAITVASPRVGIAATLGTVIAGTLAMGAVIDQFGLFGFERTALTAPRALGIALLAVGVALSLRR